MNEHMVRTNAAREFRVCICGCGILSNTTLSGTTLLGRVAELEAEVNDLRAQLSKTKADREHYRVLWEDEHCPTCYGPCAGCDDV